MAASGGARWVGASGGGEGNIINGNVNNKLNISNYNIQKKRYL